MENRITFSSFQLIIDKNQIEEQDLFNIFDTEKYTTTIEKIFYQVATKIIDNKYFWLCATYGSPNPYGEKVADTVNSTIFDNNRPKNQAELNKQLFVIYDLAKNVLYLSNSKKEKMIETCFKDKLKKEVCLKHYYKTAEEFLSIVKKIESIRLVSKKNLFSEQSGLFDDVKNIFGLGSPEQFELSISFEYANLTDSFKNIFKNWINKNKISGSNEIESLVCVGKDDKDMKSIFNISSFIEKIDIELPKNKDGMYDENRLEELVISRLKGENNV